MKKLLLILGLTFALGLASCDDDFYQDNFDHLVGRTWVGDLGVTDRVGVPLESGIFLGRDGFGVDHLFYYQQDGGQDAGELNIQWDTDNDNLYLSYGNVVPPRELRNIQVRNGQLSGTLYVNGVLYYRVTLYME